MTLNALRIDSKRLLERASLGPLLLCAVVMFGAGTLVAAGVDRKPNVILIFTDDHGFSDLSCQGIHDDIKTPHIDSLASGGVRMTSGYVTAPQCVPSRAGLLSGRYQNRFGVESNRESLDGFNAEETIAERLGQVGYATGMSGKWHLGPFAEIVEHGFDDVYYKNANRPGWANYNLDGSDREPGQEDSKLYHLDANSAAACAFIKRHHHEPFFFYCAYRAPHVPLDAPPKYLKRFPGKMPERRRQALAMISAVDDGVGSIISTLREYEIEEQTLVFFIGDNGAPLKIHKLDAPGGGPGWDGSLNDPLNGEKGMLSDGGVRVPFVVYWKGVIPPGQLYDHPVISLDVAATSVALAGLPRDPLLDGVNLVPYLSGQNDAAPHDTLYWRWIAQAAVREGQWKYLQGGARQYLFDLDADREEQHNLLTKHPEIARRLRTKLTSWSNNLIPPGVNTGQMSATWEQYYDFYLDGKSVPPPKTTNSGGRSGHVDNREQTLKGWVARNSTAIIKSDGLRIRPSPNAKHRPFIARPNLQIAGPLQATLRIRCEQGGHAGFGWRIEGQKDFSDDQTMTFDVETSGDWQNINVVIPATGRVVHLRLLLPEADSTISVINLRGKDQANRDNSSTIWRFAKPKS